MILAHRSMLFLILILLLTPFFCGQACQGAPPVGVGVNLVVGPLEEYSRALGLKDDRIFESARDALKLNGLKIDATSDLMVNVSITSMPQQDEDLFPFRVEVHGGTSLEAAQGHENESWVIADIPGIRLISIPRNDDTRLLDAVHQLAKEVGLKLRKEIEKRRQEK